MLVVRPTFSLAKRISVKLSSSPELVSSTQTGDWYAKDIVLYRRQFILAVSSTSRLAVVLRASPYAKFAERLPTAIGDLLRSIGINKDSVESEVLEMKDTVLAKTIDRSIIGTLNDYSKHLQFCARSDLDDPLLLSQKLSDIPSLVMQGTWPIKVTVELFQKQQLPIATPPKKIE